MPPKCPFPAHVRYLRGLLVLDGVQRRDGVAIGSQAAYVRVAIRQQCNVLHSLHVKRASKLTE